MPGFLMRTLLGVDRAERRDTFSIGDPALAEYFGMSGASLAGVPVTEQSAVGLTAVYRAVSIIAGTIAGLPLRTLRTADDGTRTRVKSWLDTPAGPDSDMTQFEWVELVLAHLLLHGNAPLQRVFNGAGALVGLQPIHPSAVTVKRIENAEDLANYGGPGGVFRKYFEVAMADGSRQAMTVAEIEHVTAISLDGIRGLSPIEAHRQAIATGIAGDRAAARMFGSGFLLGGLVSADEGLDRDEAEEAIAALKAKLAGSDHAGEVAMINAALKFTPWSIPPVDAQFIESRVHQVEEVSRIFGIPPHLLGQTEKQTSWGTGVAEQNRGLARYTLSPWTNRLEQRLTRLLPAPQKAEFDYTSLLQPSPEVEIPLLISQVAAGLLTVDEARRIRNLPPLPPASPTPSVAGGNGAGDLVEAPA
jgi:HK97 family phage portal protein